MVKRYWKGNWLDFKDSEIQSILLWSHYVDAIQHVCNIIYYDK